MSSNEISAPTLSDFSVENFIYYYSAPSDQKDSQNVSATVTNSENQNLPLTELVTK